MKTWLLGTHHGVSTQHLAAYPQGVRVPLQPALLPDDGVRLGTWYRHSRRGADLRCLVRRALGSFSNPGQSAATTGSTFGRQPDRHGFIFIDDDDVACAEVQTYCPEVLTLQLPRETDAIPRFLRHLWVFDRLTITEEAGQRTVLYTQHAQRERIRQISPTLRDFLASLDLQIQIVPLATEHLARAAELTQRTNQFNLATIRRSEAEIQVRCQGKTQCLSVRVTDRFGDYGIVGLMIFEPLADALSVDTFLLSCRALGRGVEYRMLAALGQIAKEQGLSWVDVGYSRTQKNRPALDFLNAVAGPTEELGGDGRCVFRLSAEAAAAPRYIPPSAEQARGASGDEPVAALAFAASTSSARQRAARLRAIALARYDASQIQKAISAKALDRERSDAPSVAPRTPLEQQLAAIFANVLNVDRVGIRDSFFDLGGDSFLVVRVLAEIERACGRRLSIATLFQAPTVEEIARILTARDSFDDSDVIVPINPSGTTPPLFGVWMGIATELRDLGRRLGAEQRFYGNSSQSDSEHPSVTSIEEMAAQILTEVRMVQPHGPYYLSSDCLSCLTVFEMAQQLCAQGEHIAALVLIDAWVPGAMSKAPKKGYLAFERLKHHLRQLADLPGIREKLAYTAGKTIFILYRIAVKLYPACRRALPGYRLKLPHALLPHYTVEMHMRAAENYVLRRYEGKISFIWARDYRQLADLEKNVWAELATETAHYYVDCEHAEAFYEPYVQLLAREVENCLDDARAGDPPKSKQRSTSAIKQPA